MPSTLLPWTLAPCSTVTIAWSLRLFATLACSEKIAGWVDCAVGGNSLDCSAPAPFLDPAVPLDTTLKVIQEEIDPEEEELCGRPFVLGWNFSPICRDFVRPNF
jgi:hypothetical protein